MSNAKKTSSQMASKAAAVLHDKNASEIAKQLAGSVLFQVNKGNVTGKEMESIAARVLQSEKYNDTTRELAASIVSQSDKQR